MMVAFVLCYPLFTGIALLSNLKGWFSFMSLITTATLTCFQCSNAFPVNANKTPEHITCPFCQVAMADDMIKEVYDALLTVADLNYHFLKYQSDRGESLFQLNVRSQEVKLTSDNTLSE